LKQAIVIATSPGRESWIKDCLESIKSPAIVVSGYGHELGKLKWVYDNTNLDRFIFLQDSVVIKDSDLLLSLFDAQGSVCIMCGPRHFGSYLGLYERETLNQLDIPEVKSKMESVQYEVSWTEKYFKLCKTVSHPVEIKHQVVETIFKHGRENQVSINKLYEKWKGTWRHDQIKED